MAHPSESPRPLLSQADISECTHVLIKFISDWCQFRGQPPSTAITLLLTAAGSLGHNLSDKHIFLRELQAFIQTTRNVYPDFTFNGDPYLGQYQQAMEFAAMEEKRMSTVH